MINAIDTVWVALSAALIFQMEGGFALLESGFIRSKNSITIIAKVFIDIIIGGIAFFLLGFAIMWGDGGLGFGIIQPTLAGLTISKEIFWFLQFGFAVAAISIVSGAIAERMKVWVYGLFVVFFVAVIYPIIGYWVWNSGGWLAQMGFNDFAGSTAVHAAGGFAAFAAAIVLGPRLGKYKKDGTANAIPGHNLTLAAVGAFILWFGWFGFNPGSTLAAVGQWELIGKVVANTFLASATGGLAAMLYTFFKYKKVDFSMTINGVLAGLVAITAGCNVVSPISALIIGLVAGVLVDIAVAFIDKLKIDDPVGAIAVHGFNGVWGTIAVGLFATKNGLFTSGSANLLGTQTIGVLAVAGFSFAVTFVIFVILKKTVAIRISKSAEVQGMDMANFGIESYSTFE